MNLACAYERDVLLVLQVISTLHWLKNFSFVFQKYFILNIKF